MLAAICIAHWPPQTRNSGRRPPCALERARDEHETRAPKGGATAQMHHIFVACCILNCTRARPRRGRSLPPRPRPLSSCLTHSIIRLHTKERNIITTETKKHVFIQYFPYNNHCVEQCVTMTPYTLEGRASAKKSKNSVQRQTNL